MKKTLCCTTLTLLVFSALGTTLMAKNLSSRQLKRGIRSIVLPVSLLDLMPAHPPFSAVAKLGQLIYEDENLSANKNQSCSSCHLAQSGFADPDNAVAPVFRPVSEGSDGSSFGGRNAPPAAYAAFSPKLHFDGDLYIGGVFWDGRASGQSDAVTATPDSPGTGDPLADQAKGPFLNPLEMALKAKEDVVDYVVKNAPYRKAFLKIYGSEIYDSNKELIYGVAYNKIAEAIAAFERSFAVNKFNSKFDRFATEQGGDVRNFGIELQSDGFRKYVGPPENFRSRFLTYDEADGLALFNADSDVQAGTGSNAGGMCYLCHLTERHYIDPVHSVQPPNPFSPDGSYPPVFTDFSYDNLGMPVNGMVVLRTGQDAVDLGLGGFLGEKAEEGKFKVPSLRNVAETAPYGHNGLFPDLYSIVHFYNARDVKPGDFDGSIPEYKDTVNKSELGKLGLSFDQEVKLVKFMRTLSDQ